MKLLGKTGPTGFLPRLDPEAYRGRAVVFWTHTVAGRSTGWLNAGFHAAFRESMLHAAVRERLFCPAYTLMPDHLHLIWMGLTDGSDQRLAARFFRRDLAPCLKPHDWQHQSHDHVLRENGRVKIPGASSGAFDKPSANPFEPHAIHTQTPSVDQAEASFGVSDPQRMKKAFAETIRYVAENPVRARLTDAARSWPYTGCVVPGYPDLHPLRADFWDKFWRLYIAAIARGALGKLPLGGDAPAV